ncbi:MAG: hypothetical protein J1F20_01195 [Muribaculaceae bacterium]|nr:hypothetical protein [Muribaculaceae bacterium]
MKKFLLTLSVAVATIISGYANGETVVSINTNKVILPSSRHTPDSPWTADVWIVNTGERYSEPNYNKIWGTPEADAEGNEWFENAYTLTNSADIDWEVKESPFTTDKWIAGEIMGDIYIRRAFTLDEIPEGPVYLACGRDDAPSEWYINGKLVHFETEGWDEGAVVLLSDEEKAALQVGENLMAVHVHQNWGGAYADCGLYGADVKLYIHAPVSVGKSWVSKYTLVENNDAIAGAVADGCFAINADDSNWTIASGPYSNSNDEFRTTYWNSDANPILVRRYFTLTDESLEALKDHGKVYLTCSYDEYPHVYLNGTEIWSAEGWNDSNYALHELNPDQIALFVEGKNVIGVSAQQGSGGGHIDFGLYVEMPCDGFTFTEDLTLHKALLSQLIEEAREALQTPQVEKAIETAEAVLATGENVKDFDSAIDALQGAIAAVRDASEAINNFNATLKIYSDATAVEQFAAAKTRDDYNNALRTLRYARRRAAADKHEDVFEGNEAAEGKFYLYNVGQKQFLQGGSDWGAHAALGFYGDELTLMEKIEDSKAGVPSFVIETGLYNGENNHYLNYRGYMDAGHTVGQDGWAFVPVEGRDNIYFIVQSDYPDVHIQWDPYGSVDGGQSDETNVCTESRNLDKANENAMWKLVTREERLALLDEASEENPVDASLFIVNPGFNQRVTMDAWEIENASVWERGGNHYDFVLESWNTSDMTLNQFIEGLPEGDYVLTVQGFYRNGSFDYQVDNDRAQYAYVVAGSDEDGEDVELPNILSESNMAPGEGRVTTTEDGEQVEFPDGCMQVTSYFKAGLYKTVVPFTVEEGQEKAVIGVYKNQSDAEQDWVVVDNFKLTYLGKPVVDGVEDVKVAPETEDNRIFNLQGIEVKNANVPGLYIRNGKKFIVR